MLLPVAERAFPTRSEGGRRESTRRANKLLDAASIVGRQQIAFVVHHLDRLRQVEVQIFGVRKNPDTRRALRFFSERRIKTHFVDLLERPAALGELRRFAQRFGVMALVDKESKRFTELALGYAQLSDDRWLEKLSYEPLLLRMPLVRNANQLTIGADEDAWRSWTGR